MGEIGRKWNLLTSDEGALVHMSLVSSRVGNWELLSGSVSEAAYPHMKTTQGCKTFCVTVSYFPAMTSSPQRPTQASFTYIHYRYINVSGTGNILGYIFIPTQSSITIQLHFYVLKKMTCNDIPPASREHKQEKSFVLVHFYPYITILRTMQRTIILNSSLCQSLPHSEIHCHWAVLVCPLLAQDALQPCLLCAAVWEALHTHQAETFIFIWGWLSPAPSFSWLPLLIP